MAPTQKTLIVAAAVALTQAGHALSSTNNATSKVANEYSSAERFAMSTDGCAR